MGFGVRSGMDPIDVAVWVCRYALFDLGRWFVLEDCQAHGDCHDRKPDGRKDLRSGNG